MAARDCGRHGYATQGEAELVARNEVAVTRRSVYLCSWDGAWHVGTDPGHIQPCKRCGTLIALRSGAAPVEAINGWLHKKPNCKRIARSNAA